MKLVAERITDAVGHDTKRKTWYLCEIKANFPDLQKAPYQIYDTAFRFPKNPLYHKSDTFVPVIALPAWLKKELEDYDNWDSLRDLCRRIGIVLWVVEQSGVREVTSPKTKTEKIVITKKAKPKLTKSEVTKKPLTKKILVKSSTAKKTKIQNIKHKTSTAKIAKPRAARKTA